MTKESFQNMLDNHDWYYQRTEDPRKYKRGEAQRRAIWDAIEELGDEASTMYLKHREKVMGV